MFRTIIGISVGASVLAAGPALAVATQSGGVSSFYTLQIIQDAAKALQLDTEISTTDQGNKFVVIHLPSGVVFAALDNCAKTPDHGSCKGMEFLARFGNKNVPLSLINDENNSQNFVQAYVLDGTVMVSRSEWQPFGFVVQNVEMTMRDFIGLAVDFAGKLETAGKGASLGTAGQGSSAMTSTPSSSSTPNYLDRAHATFNPKDAGVINPKSAP